MRSDHAHAGKVRLPSGGWHCRWIQDATVGLEELQLLVEGGSLRGSGTDLDGIFEYEGAAYREGTVSLTKRYVKAFIPVPPSISYIGHWDGESITGHWIADQDPGNHGPFQMWPQDTPEPVWSEQPSISHGDDVSRGQEWLPSWLPRLPNEGDQPDR